MHERYIVHTQLLFTSKVTTVAGSKEMLLIINDKKRIHPTTDRCPTFYSHSEMALGTERYKPKETFFILLILWWGFILPLWASANLNDGKKSLNENEMEEEKHACWSCLARWSFWTTPEMWFMHTHTHSRYNTSWYLIQHSICQGVGYRYIDSRKSLAIHWCCWLSQYVCKEQHTISTEILESTFCYYWVNVNYKNTMFQKKNTFPQNVYFL